MVDGPAAVRGGSSAGDAGRRSLKEQPKPPSELVPDVPKDLERIILRCLRKEPGRRFQHMADVKVELQELKEESDSQSRPRRPRPLRSADPGVDGCLAAVGVLVLAAAAALMLWRLRRPELPPPTVLQLTSERRAGSGSFSPDGDADRVLLDGREGDNGDIWLKIVGQAEARRLTTDPADEGSPAWSPDGKQIAFLRATTTRHSRRGIYLVSPLGRPGTPAARLPAAAPALLVSGWSLARHGKARSGADPPGGIYLISGRDRRAACGDVPQAAGLRRLPGLLAGRPVPRLRRLRGRGGLPLCDIYVLPLDAELRPAGSGSAPDPPGLLDPRAWPGRVTAARSSTARDPAPLARPRRRQRSSGARGAGRPRAAGPSTAESRDRLAFVRRSLGLRHLPPPPGGSPTPLIESHVQRTSSRSTRRTAGGSLSSRDGRAREEIWLADADGSNPTRLTRGPGRGQGSPAGRRTDARSPSTRGRKRPRRHLDDRRRRLGTAPGHARPRRRHPAELVARRPLPLLRLQPDRPHSRSGARRPPGGAEEQLTREGGAPLREPRRPDPLLPEGPGAAALLARPHGGRRGATILPCVYAWSYAVASAGHLPRGLLLRAHRPSRRGLALLGRGDGAGPAGATIEADCFAGLSVSPDGQPSSTGASSGGLRPDDDRELPLGFHEPRRRHEARALTR